jgi:hypothetical protein
MPKIVLQTKINQILMNQSLREKISAKIFNTQIYEVKKIKRLQPKFAKPDFVSSVGRGNIFDVQVVIEEGKSELMMMPTA